MKVHGPNLDMLSAYVDGVLSPDAARSMEQHLEHCLVCTNALSAERDLVQALDSLAHLDPPPDFVNAVMGRVAQYPAHRPGTAVLPWRAAARWSVAASLLLVIAIGGAAAWLVGSGALEQLEPGTLVAMGIGRATVFLATAITTLRNLIDPGLVLLEAAGRMVWRLVMLATTSGWMVQVTLLLLTISLNYALTRLVAGYQRRH